MSGGTPDAQVTCGVHDLHELVKHVGGHLLHDAAGLLKRPRHSDVRVAGALQLEGDLHAPGTRMYVRACMYDCIAVSTRPLTRPSTGTG